MNNKYIMSALLSLSCLVQADISNIVPGHSSIGLFDSAPFLNRMPLFPNIEKILKPCARVASEFAGENKIMIVGGLALTALGLVVLRKMTSNQDIPVSIATHRVLRQYKAYQECQSIIRSDNIQEVKIGSVKRCLFDDPENEKYVSRKEVCRKVTGDLRTVKNLDSWDLWLRTQCNSQLIATKNLVQERTAEIQQVLTFFKTQDAYLQAQDLHAEAHSLLTKFAPQYAGDNYITKRDAIQAHKKDTKFQVALHDSIEDAKAFGGSEEKPAYACYEALWQKQIAIDAVKKQLPVCQYPLTVDELNEMQNYLILWRGAIKELPAYKEQRPLTCQEAIIERNANYEEMALKITAATNARLTKVAEIKAETERLAQEQEFRQHDIELRQARDNCSKHEAAQRVDRERLIWVAASQASVLAFTVVTAIHNSLMWCINGRHRLAQMQAQAEAAKQNCEAQRLKWEARQFSLEESRILIEARHPRK